MNAPAQASTPKGASKSAHVIDLRQSKPAGAVPPAAASLSLKVGPKAKLQTAKKPSAKPAPQPIAVQPPAAAPVRSTAATSKTEQPGSLPAQADYLTSQNDRRFWPAFWRFLVLLVVLAVILVGGVYLYLKFHS